MIYVVSDIHGCHKEFLELLEAIDFSDDDEMYVLGDMVDKGPDPIKLIQDLMARPNIYPVMGNHDYVALQVLTKLNTEITEENAEIHLSTDDMMDYVNWVQDGGDTTAAQFTKLSLEERQEVLGYLAESYIYEEISVDGRDYILLHSGINNFVPGKPLEDYHFSDILFHMTDYNRRFYDDRFVVTGHVPTFKIREDGQPLVYEGNGHIAIDCGCIYGCKLGAYCLDTQQVTYVESHQPKRYKIPKQE